MQGGAGALDLQDFMQCNVFWKDGRMEGGLAVCITGGVRDLRVEKQAVEFFGSCGICW